MKMMPLVRTLITASLTVFVAACGNDSKTTRQGGGVPGGSSGGNAPIQPQGNYASHCTYTGASSGFRFASMEVDEFHGRMKFVTTTTNGNSFDRMELYFIGNTSATPDTYHFTGLQSNPRLFVYRGCSLANPNCEELYLGTTGSMTVTSGGGAGGTFRATFSDVEAKRIDPYQGTVISGGGTWCGDAFVIDTPIEEKAALPTCSSSLAESGNLIGENIADFNLTDCNGKTISLHDFCGDYKALWIMAVAGWCPSCSQLLPQAADLAQNQADLEVIAILGENNNYQPADQAFCGPYADAHNMPRDRVFVDHDGTYAYPALFGNIYLYPGPGGSFGLPWNVLLRGSNLEYFYSDTTQSALGMDINGALSALLNGP